MRRHPLATFLFLACAFSWTLWIGVILSSHGLLPFRIPPSPFGSLGPAFAALVTSRLVGGSPAPGEMRRSLGRVRAPLRAWAVALFLAPATYAISSAVAVAVSKERPSPQNLEKWYLVFPIALFILVLGGPLGEEVGWRGWLLPRLLQSTSPATASLVVALFWFVWHFPLFFMEGATQKGTSIVSFAAAVLAMSFLFTSLHQETNGSLFWAVAFHLSINLSGFCLGLVLPSVEASPLQGRVFLALLLSLGGF
ncbi:MAG TPA: type II CAAX endopeptidase family protein, partial [Thermoanaerobaculia bacterium]|nr:type II CAAX endopeptidase family protein [Thermoanaerobaculia bacterium]